MQKTYTLAEVKDLVEAQFEGLVNECVKRYGSEMDLTRLPQVKGQFRAILDVVLDALLGGFADDHFFSEEEVQQMSDDMARDFWAQINLARTLR